MAYIFIFLMLINFIFSIPAFAATTASQTVTATLTRTTPTPTPGGGGGGGGGAVAVAAGAGAAAVGAGGAAFAPLLLAGLSPNTIIAAAAPLGCIAEQQCFLQAAIMNNFCTKNLCDAIAKMNCNGKIYFAQNNSTILNGTFDMQGIPLPKELLPAEKIKVNITMASDPYADISGTPELSLGMYQDINQPDLRKKFETQQFLHHYLMKKYELPLRQNLKAYDKGVQKLSTVIDLNKVKNKEQPLQIVVRYTDGGFHRNQVTTNPKIKTYAYLVEFEKA